MKHLRKYKIFESNSQIDTICEKYDIKNYTINSDNSVDVDNGVYLWGKELESIPLNFNIVNGYFNCGWNYLISLKGCPVRVGDGFYCYYNNLTSLQYSPQYVENGSFSCSRNKLTSLEHHPTVYGKFYCRDNQINTFENFYYYKEDVYFDGNPIWDIYELFNDMKLIELANYYGFEYEGEIDLYKLDIFLKETNHEYDGDLREYFEGKEYKWKLID
jgi:hypothetical protein